MFQVSIASILDTSFWFVASLQAAPCECRLLILLICTLDLKMYGAGEFDNAPLLGGLEALLQAAAQPGSESGAAQTSPAATPPAVEQDAGQTLAAADDQSSDQNVIAQAIVDGADIKSLEKDRLAAARKISSATPPEITTSSKAGSRLRPSVQLCHCCDCCSHEV